MNTPCLPLPCEFRCWWATALGAALLASALGAARAADSTPASVPLELRSPDGRIIVTVNPTGALSYRLAVDGTPVLYDSRLGLRLRDGELGREVTLVKADRAESDTTWSNLLGKRRHFCMSAAAARPAQGHVYGCDRRRDQEDAGRQFPGARQYLPARDL